MGFRNEQEKLEKNVPSERLSPHCEEERGCTKLCKAIQELQISRSHNGVEFFMMSNAYFFTGEGTIDNQRWLSFSILGPTRFAPKPSLKIGSVNKAFLFWYWQWLKKIFFWNKTFLFIKIESWNFHHLFEKEFRETSQNFNSIRQQIEKMKITIV